MFELTRRSLLSSAPVVALARGPFLLGHKRPNFLFIFPDQLRYDWVGNPQIPARTPNLDWIASRGVRFQRAVVPSPLCAPARACLASGKEYDRCGVPSNAYDYPLEQPTFYAMLREAGYHVMGCGKFDLHKATLDWGLDGKRLLREWGFSDGIDNAGKWDAIRSGAETPKDPYMAFLHQRGLAELHVKDFARRRSELGNYTVTEPTPLPEEAYCDNWVANNAIQLLRRAPRNRPWFLQVNFTGPHSPMDITREMERTCRDRTFPLPNGSSQIPPSVHNAIRQNYTAMVENIDRWIGRFIEVVEDRGELENTLIVFSSDHGEMLGDHDRWGKSVPYHPSVSVPLLIAGPGVQPGVRSQALVSVMDLAATFLDYAGVRRPEDMDSRSLRPVLEGKTEHHRRWVQSGLGSWRMVWDGRYKLITGFDPSSKKGEREKAVGPLLFDLQEDPLENHNLAAADSEIAAQLWASVTF